MTPLLEGDERPIRTGILGGLAAMVTRRPRRVLLLSGLAVILAAAAGIHAPGRLLPAGFAAPNAPSEVANNRLNAFFGGSPNLIFLVQARSGTVDSPAVAAAGRTLASRLASSPGVAQVTSYWTTGSSLLLSNSGTEGLVLAHITGSDKAAADRAKSLTKQLTVGPNTEGPVTVQAGGGTAIGNAVGTQIVKDIGKAEGIAIPLTMLLLVVAFGSVVAAALPVLIGMLAILGSLAVLFLLGSITSVSQYALNMTTAMGLGLAIDYSLLMVSRYREELAGGLAPVDAVARSVVTAGRTILFSAATVAAALAALLVFPVYFLRSFAYAGISVVAVASAGALIVLPALLTALGPRVNAISIRKHPGFGRAESPFWRRIATAVMRRPLAAGIPVVIVLVVLGLPFAGVHFGTPDERVLPTSNPARQVGDALRTHFRGDANNSIDVVTAAPLSDAVAATYSRELSELKGVAEVRGPSGVWAAGALVQPAGPGTARFQSPEGTWISAVVTPDHLSGAAQSLVHQVRALPAPAGAKTYVGGAAASLVDQKHDLGARMPLAILLIVLTTFVLLWLFTGSVVLPLKAVVLNALSLTAVFGAMVWVWQDGHLKGVLGFTPLPTNTTMPLLLFCIAFGLSMDYEVFMLSRIKELHDRGESNVEAVAGGLARSGRIVTTAALLMSVTFIAFGLSKVSFIQMFGLGTALAVIMDSSLIRGVLVPSFMRVAGDINWWSPAPLRRLHDRVGLSEAPACAPIQG